MGTEEEDLQTLSRAILDEARDETEHLKAEAQSKAETIRQKAQARAQSDGQAILAKAAEEASRLRSQALATAELKARARELSQREKLLDNVFAEAATELAGVLQRKDYAEIVTDLIREAVAQLGVSSAEVRADAYTRKLLTPSRLDQISKATHAQLALGSVLEQGTGILLQTADGHVRFDNTFETRLSRLQGALRPAVFQILTGETQ